MADRNREGAKAEATGNQARPDYEPAVDMYVKDDTYVLELDVPGVGPDEVDISVEDGVLTVQTHGSAQEKGGRNILREFVLSDYYRSFGLGKEIDMDNIAATIDQGVLTLMLAKVPAAQPKKITVKGA
jgi:HSP20 family protein